MNSSTIRRLCIHFCCVFAFCVAVFALPGDPDTTFDTDGITSASLGAFDYALAVAIQPDGKIVAAGYTDPSNPSSDPDLSLARFNTDGSLDTSFGTGGKVLLPEPGVQRAHSVIILPDGKILAVGIYFTHMGVFRFNANGTPDATFGMNGKVVHVVGVQGAANDVVLQPDGKIVVVGFTKLINGAPQFTVFRLNGDGSLDTSFNSIGYNVVDSGGTEATTVALQSDGRIIVGGRFTGLDLDGYLGRFSTDGILEGPANALWKCSVSFRDVAIQPDGKIVVAGQALSTGDNSTSTTIVRFNSDLTFDTRFGNRGINSVNWGGSGILHQGNSLFLEPDGRIIMAGRAQVQFQGAFHLAIARFNSHGFLDIGFGNGGKVLTPSGQVSALARQPDGKIVSVGYTDVPGGADYVVTRHNTGPSNTFPARTQFDWDGDGRADIAVFRPSTAQWFILKSFSSGADIRTFGLPGDVPIHADYDGDARTDHGVIQNGYWWRLFSNGNGVPLQHPFQITGNPRPGDFTGDGRADYIAWAGFGWWKRRGSNPDNQDVFFGIAEDKPLLGDFDGDMRVDPAIYRMSTGEWWWVAGGQQLAARWGIAEDIPVPGDYDGDFKTDFAVYRPSQGVWYVYASSNGAITIMRFGLAEDKPVAADYDGDGRADIAVYRPSTGTWYLMQSTSGFAVYQWGLATDIPIPGAYVP